MARKNGSRLGSSLLLAGGIMASAIIAVAPADSGWLVLTAPLLLAFTVLGVDVMESWPTEKSTVPSVAAWLLAGSILSAGLLTALRDPELVKSLIPVIGGAGFVLLMRRPEGRRQVC